MKANKKFLNGDTSHVTRPKPNSIEHGCAKFNTFVEVFISLILCVAIYRNQSEVRSIDCEI